ncbi:MAG: hypothetical protein ABL872_08180 [Lacibacter sp.]
MKLYILFIFFSASFYISYSQTTVPGYYVTNNNDSVDTQIKIPKSLFGTDLSKLLLKVEIVDSINGTKKFKPKDIKGFGFTYKEKHYHFFSKPAITERNVRFLQPFIIGQKTSVYWFHTVDQNGIPLGTFYTFEKADGTYTFFSTGELSLSRFRASLKEFYKDYPEVQQLIDTKFQTKPSLKHDITEIVEAVNKL